MTIHILDFLMWFVVVGVFWFLLDKLGGGEYTEELGGLAGMMAVIVITIIYIVLFGFMGWDWINIFRGVNPIDWLDLKL
jgi:hypothetical protein